MGLHPEQRGRTELDSRTRSTTFNRARSPARPTPSGSSARSTPINFAVNGSIPEVRTPPLAAWADEFLSLCRRLSPTTQKTYRRDLDKYALPRFGS